MKVSIITATYNSSKLLKRTLNSVQNQDYDNIEHIIIDGGSTDGTIEILNNHKQQISILISEKDSGIYDALNKGLKLATGDIIGFLNSDDYFASIHSVSSVVNAFKTENADVVYGDLLYQADVDAKVKTIRYWKSNPFNPNSLKFGWMPPHPTVYCKREVYETYGHFNSTMNISADYDFILRIFKLPNITKTYIPKVIVNMQIGGTSNDSIKNLFVKTKEDYMAARANNCGGFTSVFFKNIRKIKQFFSKYNP